MTYKTLLVAASLAASASVHAAIQTNGVNTTGANNTTAVAATYTGSIVTNDLLQTQLVGTPTFSASALFGGAPKLYDGLGFNTTTPTADSAYLNTLNITSDTNTITFNLNTTVNTLGYDITSINTFGGWWENKQSCANQNYDVFVRQVGSSTYTLLTTVAYNPLTTTAGSSASMVTTHDSVAGAAIATGVDSVRFSFHGDGVLGGNPNGVVYHEIDVIGTVTAVPEPSTYGLMGAGALAAITFVRRRRKQG